MIKTKLCLLFALALLTGCCVYPNPRGYILADEEMIKEESKSIKEGIISFTPS